VDDVDRARERRGAVVDRRRAAQHLDAFHVGQADRLERRSVGPARGHAVEQQQEIVGLAQAQQRRHGARGPGVATRRHGGTADQREGRAQVAGAARDELVVRHDAHRDRHLLHRLAEARGRDLHDVDARLGRRRGRRRGRRVLRAAGHRSKGDAEDRREPRRQIAVHGPSRQGVGTPGPGQGRQE
jgi:hypothetical protein